LRFPKTSEQTLFTQVMVMTGRSLRRLLAVFGSTLFTLLIFSLIVLCLIFAIPELLKGQSARAEYLAVNASSPLLVTSSVSAVRTERPTAELTSLRTLSTGNFTFRQLAHSAGIIFLGRVTSVGSVASATSTSGRFPQLSGLAAGAQSESVTFRVEHGLRGSSSGERLTIHEWAGLRNSGERYRVGERVLLFLYTPSKLGLTSPVAGSMGRFAIDGEGKVRMSAQHLQMFATDAVLRGKSLVPYADFERAFHELENGRMNSK
jgi:hypothetical protein